MTNVRSGSGEQLTRDEADEVDEVDEAMLPRLQQMLQGLGTNISVERDVDGDLQVAIEYPNGKDSRRVVYYLPQGSEEEAAARLSTANLSRFVFLAEYQAVVDKLSGTIEAQLAPYGASTASHMPATRFTRLPGIEILDPDPDPGPEAEDEEGVGVPRTPEDWRLRVSRGGIQLEVSPMSSDVRLLLRGRTTGIQMASLKITGVTTATHDEAVEALGRLGTSFLFDIDLRYGLGVRLAERRTRGLPIRARQRVKSPPEFPSNSYAADALALYRYGRSAANGLPLLEFLAYYQCLEYFFPVFYREEQLRVLRTALLHPTFDPRDDRSLNRILSVAGSGRNSGTERDHLRATLRACIDTDTLRDFLSGSEGILEHFCTKKQKIDGVQRIQLDSTIADLRDQVADRIYAIRCRIVHTKQDGGEAGTSLLLPSSREVYSLNPDIALLRLVAQHALIDRATAL